MARYDLEGDQTGLPRTKRGGMPYEIDIREYSRTYGMHGGSVDVPVNQLWQQVPQWATWMVGEVSVQIKYVTGFGDTPYLSRQLPESRDFRDRNLWCMSLQQADQFGRPVSGINHADALEGWPATKRTRWRSRFENVIWDMLSDTSADAYKEEAQTAHTYGGVPELYRYMQRMQQAYSSEQRIPAATVAGGFKVAEGVGAGKPIGQVGFRTISMADVVMKWMRVPLGWPPPRGWVPPGAAPYWPPRVNPVNPASPDNRPTRDRFKGTVNDDWFDVGPVYGYAWAPETLLYVGYDDSMRYFDAAGTLCCDYTFRFKFKEGGWNKFLNAKGEWVTVTLEGTLPGTKPYSTSDLNYLFEYQRAP